MYRICKIFEVESGHMLSKHPGACRFPHGHSRRIEVVVESRSLNENDMVIDFKHLKESVSEFIQKFDHSMCVNTSDETFEKLERMYGKKIIGFGDCDPTTEVMARMIFDYCYAVLPNSKVHSVRVWETSSSWAEYENE